MKGIVYCIKDKASDEILYVGSTKMTFNQRIQEHKRDCFVRLKNAPLYQYCRQKSSKDNFLEYFVFKIVKEGEYESRQELYKDERLCFDELKPILNKNKPFRSEQEKKQQVHEWYLKHADAENERLKSLPKNNNYYKNKDMILEKRKIYYRENRERIREYQKKYYQEHKNEQH